MLNLTLILTFDLIQQDPNIIAKYVYPTWIHRYYFSLNLDQNAPLFISAFSEETVAFEYKKAPVMLNELDSPFVTFLLSKKKEKKFFYVQQQLFSFMWHIL